MTRASWLIVLILLAAAAILASPRVRRFLAVDSCLDSGGCWDHVEQSCRHDVDRCP